jgi:leucyl aminopeptidase
VPNTAAPAQPLPTTIELSTSGVAEVDARVVAVGFTRADSAVGKAGQSEEPGDYVLGLDAQQAVADLGVDAFTLLDRAKASGSAGEVVSLELFGFADEDPTVEQVMLVGLGDGRGEDYRRAGAVVARTARRRGPLATSIAALADDDQLGAFAEGLVLGAFGFHRKSEETKSRKAPVVVLTDVTPGDDKDGAPRRRVIDAAVTRAKASWRSRTFALTPSNEKGPPKLEQWAREAAENAKLDITVWDEKKLAADGFGGILAVGAGSAYESRFVRLDYTPRKANRRAPHLVIVGKGITFDSGGISIKPRDAMMTMKRDMTGAGVVIAVLGALRDLDVPVKVTGLVPSAENAFGAASMKPGDVITHYGGRTSFVGNTDAEGRLVLADALAYAARHLDATAVVDIATLTGAGKVALGLTLGALFANDEDLARRLEEAGRTAGEPLWRLPLHAEYESKLAEMSADATNAAGGPGSITAALFLQHFTGEAPWAHLDIASVGDSPKDAYEYTQGATGFGSRVLLRWIESYT